MDMSSISLCVIVFNLIIYIFVLFYFGETGSYPVAQAHIPSSVGVTKMFLQAWLVLFLTRKGMRHPLGVYRPLAIKCPYCRFPFKKQFNSKVAACSYLYVYLGAFPLWWGFSL